MRALQEDHGIPADRAAAIWELYITESMRTTAGMRRTIVGLEELLANPKENSKLLLELLSLWGIQGLQMPNKWESLEENIAPVRWERFSFLFFFFASACTVYTEGRAVSI